MQRIALKTAQALIEAGCRAVEIVERPRGYAICIEGDILRSVREDELTFLTIDGVVNYVRRHLAPPSPPALRVTIECVRPGER